VLPAATVAIVAVSPDPIVSLRRHVLANAGIATTALAATLVGVRVLRVSHGNQNTAFEILRSLGTTGVLTAALVTTIPVVAAAVAGRAVGQIVRGLDRHINSIALEAVAIFAAFFFLSVLIAAVLCAIAAVHLIWRWIQKRRDRAPGGGIAVPQDTFIFIGGMLLVVLAVLPDRIWLPTESVSIDGAPAQTMYVLSNSTDERTVLLAEEDRAIVVADPSDISNRFICSDESWWNRPIHSLLGGESAQYPDCPK
jgi:MFS family permease